MSSSEHEFMVRSVDDLSLDMLEPDKRIIDITEKNVTIINAILRIDSSYRNAFDENDESGVSSAYLISHEPFLKEDGSYLQDKNCLEKIIKRINIENSTHLAVAGAQSDVLDVIYGRIGTLKAELESRTPTLVDDIAKSCKARDSFSFATKFCHYVSLYTLQGEVKDSYPIYDRVLADVLAYYYLKYAEDKQLFVKTRCRTCRSVLDELILVDRKASDKQYRYEVYRNFIDAIISGVEREKKFRISRTDLDHLLWYYYKGDVNLRNKVNEQFVAMLKELKYKNR